MFFIMPVPMQRLIIQTYEYYSPYCFKADTDPLNTHPVFLCVDDTMVSKFGKKLKMFQNCLIMLHKMVPTISMDTVL